MTHLKKIAAAAGALARAIDLQDMLLAGGLISIVYGAALIYKPAGYLTTGAVALFFAGLIQRSKGSK